MLRKHLGALTNMGQTCLGSKCRTEREQQTTDSVQIATAVWSSTQARDFLVLQWEFVVVRNLLAKLNFMLAVDDDALLISDCDDLGVAIRLKKEHQEREVGEIFNTQAQKHKRQKWWQVSTCQYVRHQQQQQ